MLNNEEKPEGATKIPLFTVSKNGAILKNLFLNILAPLDDDETLHPTINKEIKILVGRHPGCQIVLDHPSISRFHLEIRLQPSIEKLSVIDLSSVHGTWVFDRKIEPRVAEELVEGDELRLGASSRIYKLRWISLDQEANRGESPKMSEKEEVFQGAAQIPTETMLESPNPSCTGGEHSAAEMPQEGEEAPGKVLIDENQSPKRTPGPGLFSARESIGSSLPIRYSLETATRSNRKDLVNQSLPIQMQSKMKSLKPPGCSPIDPQLMDSLSSLMVVSELKSPGREKQSPLSIEGENNMPNSVPSVQPGNCLPEIDLQKKEDKASEIRRPGQVLNERESLPPNLEIMDASCLWSRRCKSASSIRIQAKGPSCNKLEVSDTVTQAIFKKENAVFDLDDGRKSFYKVLFSGSDKDEELASDKENMTPKALVSVLNCKLMNTREHKKQGLNSSPSKITKSEDMDDDIFASDKENATPPKVLCDRKPEKPRQENRTRFKPVANEVKAERIPFQALSLNLDSNNESVSTQKVTSNRDRSSKLCPNATSSNTNSANQLIDHMVHVLGDKRKWNMVVDTSCLLDEESRRSLRLLEGVKGTQLIIPRIVIRELDYLKRGGKWFTKSGEASSILQWIEECMTKTKWWIHLQSSEEHMFIAPTPPGSPHTCSSGEKNDCGGRASSSMHLSNCVRLMEIMSPTAEDHVLEYALRCKKIQGDQQLVLLTNDVSLKIKAMAEGLICETAREFRESLVNPYSQRFLWAESSPRGPTWSFLDEAQSLKDNYSQHWPAVRKTPKAGEGAKGLKLILLHNSHHGRIH